MTKSFKELQGMNATDLAAKLQEVRKEQIKLQAQVAIGTVPKNSLQIRNHKRTTARILTLLNHHDVQNLLHQKTPEATKKQKETTAKTKLPVAVKQKPTKPNGQ